MTGQLLVEARDMIAFYPISDIIGLIVDINKAEVVN